MSSVLLLNESPLSQILKQNRIIESSKNKIFQEQNLLGQWLNFKLFGITYLVGKIKFKPFFSGSIGWVRKKFHNGGLFGGSICNHPRSIVQSSPRSVHVGPFSNQNSETKDDSEGHFFQGEKHGSHRCLLCWLLYEKVYVEVYLLIFLRFFGVSWNDHFPFLVHLFTFQNVQNIYILCVCIYVQYIYILHHVSIYVYAWSYMYNDIWNIHVYSIHPFFRAHVKPLRFSLVHILQLFRTSATSLPPKSTSFWDFEVTTHFCSFKGINDKVFGFHFEVFQRDEGFPVSPGFHVSSFFVGIWWGWSIEGDQLWGPKFYWVFFKRAEETRCEIEPWWSKNIRSIKVDLKKVSKSP